VDVEGVAEDDPRLGTLRLDTEATRRHAGVDRADGVVQAQARRWHGGSLVLPLAPDTSADAAAIGGAEPLWYPRSAMAAVCDICGKKPWFGKSVTFSHKRNNRRWDPNIQRVRAIVDGSPKRVNACTSCIKAGKVVRPSHA
jgi:large subunit ribosomal protein L28